MYVRSLSVRIVKFEIPCHVEVCLVEYLATVIQELPLSQDPLSFYYRRCSAGSTTSGESFMFNLDPGISGVFAGLTHCQYPKSFRHPYRQYY